LLSRQHFRWFLVLYKYSFTPSFLELPSKVQLMGPASLVQHLSQLFWSYITR
jgi:hypothetical protein